MSHQSLSNTAATNSLIRTGDGTSAQSAAGLIDATGAKSAWLNSTGKIVREDGSGVPDSVVTLTDAATVTWAWNQNVNLAKVTLGGSRTLSITGAKAGDIGFLEVIQDGTGSRVLTYPTTTLKPSTPLTTTASAVDLLGFVCIETAGPTFLMFSDTKNVS